MKKLKNLLAKYRETINPPYSKKDYPVIAGTLLLLLVAVVAVINLPNRFKTEQDKQSRAQGNQKEYKHKFVSNEVLIKVKRESKGKVKENKDDTGIENLNKIGKDKVKISRFEKIAKQGKNSKTDSDLFLWYIAEFDGPKSTIGGEVDEKTGKISSDNPATTILSDLINEIKNDKDVDIVQPNFISTTLVVPNDPYYSSSGSWGQTFDDLYGMKKINAASAWDQTTGSASILVADIDTGVDRNHPDIAANMWVNSAETPNNGVDDDGNGYIDDYYGWDFINRDNDPMDDHGHGTHTVGTIAAVGNNGVGVVGVNWTSKIMALKFLSGGGSGNNSDAVKAIQYAADKGARVSSNSWGCRCYDSALADAIKYAHDRGMVTVAAAGNSNDDALSSSPASADYAIAVAASDYNDAKASFSNWGEKIDVAAPGVDILSTRAITNPMCSTARTVGTNYCKVSGTSMATPHVAGLAALLLAKNPSLSNEQVRQLIRTGAADLGTAGKDPDFGYGRVDAAGSLNLANTNPLAPVITSPSSLDTINGTSYQVTGSIPGGNFASYKIEAGAGTAPTAWTTLSTSSSQVTSNGVLANINTTSLTDGYYIIRLTATSTTGKTYQFQVYGVTVDNLVTKISGPTTLPYGTASITGTANVIGASLANYKLEWAEGDSPTSWSTAGITMANGGTQAVVDGTLGTWDAKMLTEGNTYTLRLTVTTSDNRVEQLSKTYTINNVLAMISTPVASSFGAVIDITGVAQTANGLGFTNYTLEWGMGISPASWSTSGISLVNGGTQPVNSDKLAAWDTTDISNNDTVTLRLTVNGADGKTKQTTKLLLPQEGLLPGWPKLFGSGFINIETVIGDITGDGQEEIIVATDKNPGYNMLSAYKKDGTSLPGWPATISSGGFNGAEGSLLIADINSDGKKEVLLNTPFSGLNVIGGDGNNLPGWPKQVTDWPSTPAVADMDGNGSKEVVGIAANALGTWKLNMYDGQGNMISGYPKVITTDTVGVGANMVLVDVEGDGKKEIILSAGADKDNNGQTILDRVYVLDNLGNIRPGFPKFVTPLTSNQVGAADITGDGRAEIVSLNLVPLSSGSNGTLAVFEANGNPLPNYPQILDLEYPNNGFAFVDVTGDGTLDIILTSIDSGCPPYVFTKNGRMPQPAQCYYGDGLRVSHYTNPAVVDIDGNGQAEVIGGDSSINIYFSGEVVFTGITALKSYNAPEGFGWEAFWWKTGFVTKDQPRASDLDNNGRFEVAQVVQVYNSSIGKYENFLYLWELPITNANSANTKKWPQFLGDEAKSAIYPPGPVVPTPTPTPCPAGLLGVLGGLVGIQACPTPTPLPPTPTNTPPPATPTSAPSNTPTPTSVVPTPVPNDQIAPTVSMINPTNGAIVGTRSTITLSATATDNVGVTRVEFRVNNKLNCSDTTSPYTCIWKVPAPKNKSYTIQARAYDAAGNTSNSSVTVTAR